MDVTIAVGTQPERMKLSKPSIKSNVNFIMGAVVVGSDKYSTNNGSSRVVVRDASQRKNLTNAFDLDYIIIQLSSTKR